MILYNCVVCKKINLLADEVKLHHNKFKCKDCVNKYYREWRIRTKFYSTTLRRSKLKTRFGMTIKEYDDLNEFQQGGCAICRFPCKTGNRLAVDHDHKTKQIRGLLCNNCNAALGLLNEDENLLINMIEYLKKYKIKQVA